MLQQIWNIVIKVKVRPVETCAGPDDFYICNLPVRGIRQPLQIFTGEHKPVPIAQPENQQIETSAGLKLPAVTRGSSRSWRAHSSA